MRKTSAAAIGLAIALGGAVLATATPVAGHGDAEDTSTTHELTVQEPGLQPQPAAELDTVTIGTGTLEAPREVTVMMTDTLAFDPGIIVVAAGETIRFVLMNPSAAPHEFVIGDAAAQEDHALEMATGMMHDDPGAETMHAEEGAMHHDEGAAEPNEVYLEPGASGELVWTFDEPGELFVGCHVPGHWEAGMRATIETVSIAAA